MTNSQSIPASTSLWLRLRRRIFGANNKIVARARRLSNAVKSKTGFGGAGRKAKAQREIEARLAQEQRWAEEASNEMDSAVADVVDASALSAAAPASALSAPAPAASAEAPLHRSQNSEYYASNSIVLPTKTEDQDEDTGASKLSDEGESPAVAPVPEPLLSAPEPLPTQSAPAPEDPSRIERDADVDVDATVNVSADFKEAKDETLSLIHI